MEVLIQQHNKNLIEKPPKVRPNHVTHLRGIQHPSCFAVAFPLAVTLGVAAEPVGHAALTVIALRVGGVVTIAHIRRCRQVAALRIATAVTPGTQRHCQRAVFTHAQ